jgi:hypothetical protein
MFPTVTTILVIFCWLSQSEDANLQEIDNMETFFNIDTITCFNQDNKLLYDRDWIVSCNSLLLWFVLKGQSPTVLWPSYDNRLLCWNQNSLEWNAKHKRYTQTSNYSGWLSSGDKSHAKDSTGYEIKTQYGTERWVTVSS